MPVPWRWAQVQTDLLVGFPTYRRIREVIMTMKRILIVGGVAGGASCAARARRLSEEADITVFERGPHVYFANCGLPYYVGNVIKKEDSLLVATPELFKKRFNIDVRTEWEVTSINRSEGTIQAKDLKTGEVNRERYDALVLSPGAQPIRPPLPGIDLPGIFVTRTIPDTRQIRHWIAEKEATRRLPARRGRRGSSRPGRHGTCR